MSDDGHGENMILIFFWGYLAICIFFPIYVVWFIKNTFKAPKDHDSLFISERKKPSVAIFLGYLLFFLFFVAVAIPNFIGFENPATQSFAKVSMRDLYTAQQNYFSIHGKYADGPQTFTLLGWKQMKGGRYALFCGDDFIPNTRREAIPRSARPSVVASSATGFTCAAVGNIDKDPDLDIWTINDSKILANPMNDI